MGCRWAKRGFREWKGCWGYNGQLGANGVHWGKGVKRGFVGIMGCLRHKCGVWGVKKCVWGRKGVFWGVIVSFFKVFMKRNFRL